MDLGPLSRVVLADAVHSCSFVPVLVPDGATSVDEQAGVGGLSARVREAPEEGLSCAKEFADVIDGCSGAWAKSGSRCRVRSHDHAREGGARTLAEHDGLALRSCPAINLLSADVDAAHEDPSTRPLLVPLLPTSRAPDPLLKLVDGSSERGHDRAQPLVPISDRGPPFLLRRDVVRLLLRGGEQDRFRGGGGERGRGWRASVRGGRRKW